MLRNVHMHLVGGVYPDLDAIKGIEFYGSRALCLALPGDVVCLHPKLQKFEVAIRRHQELTGLGMPELVWSIEPADLAGIEGRVSVFKFDDRFYDVRPNNAWHKAAMHFDDKNNFIEKCVAIGVPVPETYCFDSGSLALGSTKRPRFPFLVKASHSASGQGVVWVENTGDVINAIRKIGYQRRMQFQAPVSGREGSFLFFVDETTVRRVGATEQFTPDGVHEGNNDLRCDDSLWRHVDPFVQHLQTLGFRGYCGIDVMFTGGRVYALECNPRSTAGVYFQEAARMLGFEHWKGRSITLARPDLDLAAVEDLLVTPGSDAGIVICNWAIPAQKLQIMAVGDPQRQNELLGTFALRIGARSPLL